MFIYSYDQHSESARALAGALGARQIRTERSEFKGKHDKVVINWGSSDLPREVRKCKVINKERNVMMALNKLTCFDILEKAVPDFIIVPWTTDRTIAQGWAEHGKVVARTRLKGADGAGLIMVDHRGRVPEAKLYTKFIQAEKEYRITVCRGDGVQQPEYMVVGRQRKIPLDDVPRNRLTPDVKTTAGGYGFKWVTLNIPGAVEDVSKAAVEALGLDFGGVDVIWDGAQAHVLEVNTAPHLTPIMVTRMSEALRGLIG
jgi:glutathione synthase/RimK-type ligase-like ATP-grasp enzyme